LFKMPYKGPYRIKNLGPRNVELIDLESGREHTSYIEFLKPLSVKEFKLILSKNWDLHFNHEKRIRNLQTESILDKADDPYTLGEIFEIEKINPDEIQSANRDDDQSDDDFNDDTADPDPLEGTSTAYFNSSSHELLKNPLLLGKELNKNEMDGLALLNNKIIKNIRESAKCVEGLAFNLPEKPVLVPGRQAEPLDEIEFANAKCQPEKETECEHSLAAASESTSCSNQAGSMVLKGEPSRESKETSTEENVSVRDDNQSKNSLDKKSKKVGFKTFVTRFFDSNK
jgi:hypothetical protein